MAKVHGSRVILLNAYGRSLSVIVCSSALADARDGKITRLRMSPGAPQR